MRRAQTWWWSMFTWRGSAGIQPESSSGNRTSPSSSRQGYDHEYLLIKHVASFWPVLKEQRVIDLPLAFLLQWCQLSAASFRLWTEHSLQVASQTQVLLEFACSCLETRILKWAGEERNTGMFFCVDVWANGTDILSCSRNHGQLHQHLTNWNSLISHKETRVLNH